jgi:hypothetical protein
VEAVQFDGGAAPAAVGAALQTEGHGPDPFPGGDGRADLDGVRPGRVEVAGAQDGACPRGPEGRSRGELDELLVRLSDRLSEHPVDRPLAAEDGEEAFGEESVRREGAGRYGAA